MVEDVIETQTAKILLRADGIICYVSLSGVEVNLPNAQEGIEIVRELAAGQMVPILTDLRNLKSIERDARNHFAGEEAKRIALAVAILIDSPLSRMTGNLYLRASKPMFPVKIFTSEEAAIEWLRGFLE